MNRASAERETTCLISLLPQAKQLSTGKGKGAAKFDSNETQYVFGTFDLFLNSQRSNLKANSPPPLPPPTCISREPLF